SWRRCPRRTRRPWPGTTRWSSRERAPASEPSARAPTPGAGWPSARGRPVEGGGVTLRLELRVPSDPLRRADPAPVTLVLTNAGPAPLVVNRRMAPGYVDSVSREVYFDVD